MKVTSKNRVTIPKYVREKLGMLPGSEVEFVVCGNSVHLIKSVSTSKRGGEIHSHRTLDREK